MKTSLGLPPVVQIIGSSGAGKTTLIERLTRVLSRRGYRIGVVKHHGHGRPIDVPGKDTDRFRRAGATGIVLAAAKEHAFFGRWEKRPSLGDLANRPDLWSGCDLLLAEGFHREPGLKIEVFRKGISDRLICRSFSSGVIGLVTDDSVDSARAFRFRPKEANWIADWILAHFGLSRTGTPVSRTGTPVSRTGTPVSRTPLAATAVVLAGGSSRRMGRDKAWLALQGGTPLVESILDRLRPWFREVIVVTKTPERFRRLGVRAVRDRFVSHSPLVGIEAGLSAARHRTVFVQACDMPSVDLGIVQELLRRVPGYDAVLPRTSKGIEPLHAVYAKRCATRLRECLRRGERAVHRALGRLRLRLLGARELGGRIRLERSLFNLNSPADLRSWYSHS